MFTSQINQNRAIFWIVFLGLMLRITNIDAMPPYIDEMLHINDSTDYSVTSPGSRFFIGKYFTILLFKPIKLIASDPLYASRILVSLFSSITIFYLYKIGKVISAGSVGLLAALFYAISPCAVFFDRQALTDPIITSLIVTSNYWLLKSIKNKTRYESFVSGFLYALALVSKITSVFFLAPYVIATIRNRSLKQFFTYPAYLFLIGVVTSILFLLATSYTPGYSLVNKEQMLSIIKLFTHQDSAYIPLKERYSYLYSFLQYNGRLFALLNAAIILLVIRYKNNLKLVLTTSIFLILLFFSFYYPVPVRHMHTLTALISMLLAINLYLLSKNKIHYFYVCFFLVFVNQIYMSSKIINNPYYNVSKKEKFDYIDGWASASGINEIAKKLINISLDNQDHLYVITTKYGMQGSNSLEYVTAKMGGYMHFYHDWVFNDEKWEYLRKIKKHNKIVFLLEHPYAFVKKNEIETNLGPTKSIYKYQKIDSNSSYELLEVE